MIVRYVLSRLSTAVVCQEVGFLAKAHYHEAGFGTVSLDMVAVLRLWIRWSRLARGITGFGRVRAGAGSPLGGAPCGGFASVSTVGAVGSASIDRSLSWKPGCSRAAGWRHHLTTAGGWAGEKNRRNGADGREGTSGGWACQAGVDRQRAVSGRVGANPGLGRTRAADRVTGREVIDERFGRPGKGMSICTGK
jgi:hypothetical protein